MSSQFALLSVSGSMLQFGDGLSVDNQLKSPICNTYPLTTWCHWGNQYNKISHLLPVVDGPVQTRLGVVLVHAGVGPVVGGHADTTAVLEDGLDTATVRTSAAYDPSVSQSVYTITEKALVGNDPTVSKRDIETPAGPSP